MRTAPSTFVGSGDHLVSEAFYFTDPEGNGVELFRGTGTITAADTVRVTDAEGNVEELKTKDILKQALADFDGTLVCVSHDRDFLDGLVSKVYEFGGGRVREHLCGIYEFLQTKKMEELNELERRNG